MTIAAAIEAASVPCVGCGYDLRGVANEATCPECGAPARASRKSDRLHFADAGWLRECVRGLDTVMAGLVFGVVMIPVLGTVVTLSGAQPPVVEVITWAFAVLPGLVIARGCWRLTMPEPGEPPDAHRFAREIAHFGVIALTILAILWLPAYLIDPVVGGGCLMLGGIVAMAGGFAAMAYARYLASRIPDPALVRAIRMLIGLYLLMAAGAAIGFVFAGILFSAMMSDLPSVLEPFLAAVMIMSALGLLLELLGLFLAGMGTLILTIRFRFAFARVLREMSDARIDQADLAGAVRS